MELIRTVADLRARLDPERAAGKQVGMVGTSGGMHRGHQSLVRRSVEENDITAMYWGGAPADLTSWSTSSTFAYERDASHDWPLAEEAGCDILFAPPAEVLFPRAPATTVTLPSFSMAASGGDGAQLEDPAHLDLIALAMCKLWNMFGPCRNYFGAKDWQQLVMFIRLAEDLEYPVEVVGAPTIREDDGVAVSSRNSQLTPEQRAVAPVLYRALGAARDAALGGTTKSTAVEEVFTDTVGSAAAIQYFAVVDGPTMTPLDELAGSVRILASIALGDTRLLDNIGIELPATRSGT
ncbi:MAG TPA: pantoate--beta-alanine ligase [Acidimicrobiia bacterium]|nr:pantoate--beta-alanine ligase [Acidimicrobiia bacterium]